MAPNAVSLAHRQHYDGLALQNIHALGSTSMHHINTPRLAATVCSTEANMYCSPENARGLARRRTMNSALYNSIIIDVPENPLSGYLSDISEDTDTFGDEDDVPQFTNTKHDGQRRYLNRCITESPIDEIPGWPQPTAAYMPPPVLKVNRGSSLKALGRRLSLNIMPNASQGRFRPNTKPLAQHTPYSTDGSRWSLQPRRRTSWLDSIKLRFKEIGRRPRQDAEAIPIRTYHGLESREPIDEDDTQGRFEPTTPTFQYPRLRSQPSLCPTSATADGSSPIRARDDASFVPDIDNTPDQPRTPTPQRQPRKSKFLLPHRLSIVSTAQYGVLD